MSNPDSNTFSDLANTTAASIALNKLRNSWETTDISPEVLAAMLTSASHTFHKLNTEQTLELVWTGPTSPFVSARRTEQALLQVIESSREALFITSFVAYDVSSIVKALNSSISRGVKVLMLLESSSEYGGSVSIDVIGKMKDLVPKATIFAWSNKSPAFFGGRVHAKIALADNKMCFITSANLTGFAMEKNMEAGVLINGGRLPIILQRHLQSLITLKLIDHV
jgi:phosphatidylserine/phosphatidylglycerophosphate/cardiolipin synthase-like enzyme